MRTKDFIKRLSFAFLASASIVSCSEYDDSGLWNEVNSIKDRVSNIESKLSGMNQDIQSVYSIVNAVKDNVYIVSVTPTADGYEIVMSNGKHITIRNGRDGKDGHDGVDGTDGKDGKDGVDGQTPVIGVSPVDGIYYWTVTIGGRTEFLLDAAGNKIPATGSGSGSVAPAPVIKVDYYGYWVISYDGGVTFDYIRDSSGNPVKAVAEGGDGIFREVYQDGDYIVFVLTNGTTIRIKSCNCESSSSELEKNYISIDGATYVNSSLPEATTTNKLTGVEMSDRVMNGAMNYISVTTTQSVSKFFIAIKGVTGYLDYTPVNSGSSQGYNSYVIPVMISPNYNGSSTIIIKARLTNGEITSSVENNLSYIETKPGAIEVKLAFSNSKDVDLHLYTPSGEHIYFGHRGGTFTTSTGTQITYGLDVDSNAACNIDNINKENIYIPAELVEEGTYKVVVNMFSNCDRSTATNWSIVTRYKGDIITPLSGSNPAAGVYPVGAKNGDNTQVMTFKINDKQMLPGKEASCAADKYTWKFTPVMPTWEDLDKMDSQPE